MTIYILIACWLANRNPELTDKTIFKDMRIYKKKK